MKNYLSRLIPIGALGLIFILYSVALFLFAELGNGTLWLGYGFTVLAFVLSGVVFWFKMPDLWSVKDDLYQTPIIAVCSGYVFLSIILGIVSALLPVSTIKWIILLELVLLVAFAIMIVIAMMSAGKLVELHEQNKGASAELAQMENRLKTVAQLCNDPQLAAQIRRLAEDVHFSTPNMKGTVSMQDQMLDRAITELEAVVKYGSTEEAAAQLRQLEIDLKTRNRSNNIGK